MKVILPIICYSLCSGTMLVLNKALTIYFPPGLIATIQFLFAVLSIPPLCHPSSPLRNAIPALQSLPALDPFSTPILRGYLNYAAFFLVGVYSNMKTLEGSNVDTVIVFRSSVPILVCTADVLFMGRHNPNLRSKLSMGGMAIGAFFYVLSDNAFKMDGLSAYFWVVIYFFAIAAEMVVGKMITRDLKVSLSTSVFLTNALTIPFMATLSLSTETWDNPEVQNNRQNPQIMSLLFVSCLAGTAIGYTGWWCRDMVSATTYTVVGVCNKFLTVILNIMIWDKHASPFGTFCLLVCLAGGCAYQQAPVRDPSPPPELNGIDSDVEMRGGGLKDRNLMRDEMTKTDVVMGGEKKKLIGGF